jgi:hypothetical protein
MKQIVVYTILLMNVFLVSCSNQSASAQAKREPVFSVESKHSDDQITLQSKANTTIIEIDSPSGIGSARFNLESGDMPEQIVVQIHVKALEEFRLISKQNSVSASVSSGDGLQAQSHRKSSGNSEQAIRAGDAFWLNIKIVSDSQQIPLEDGYFEINIPVEFIKQSGSSFEIHWIDFYR